MAVENPRQEVGMRSKLFWMVLLASSIVCLASEQGLRSAQSIQPDVKVNGSNGTVSLAQTESLRLSLAMQNNGVTDSCDWWLAMVTPFGAYFLALPDGLTTSVTPLYQGPLFGFGLTDLFTLPLAAVPEGTYAFYFGVDRHPDGEITPEPFPLIL
ncbi:MAG: hypothetical protein MUP74_01650, partial [Desulfobacterales bacterium]|nr:hypothetical protein [Desulfobacterales bacterium]